MLGQVADMFASIAQSSVLQSTHIPFTDLTIGQALDYATVFKHEVLDPLFKSGDILHPDSNGDNKVDLADLNFNGIQSLLSRIAVVDRPQSERAHRDLRPGDERAQVQLPARPVVRARHSGRGRSRRRRRR